MTKGKQKKNNKSSRRNDKETETVNDSFVAAFGSVNQDVEITILGTDKAFSGRDEAIARADDDNEMAFNLSRAGVDDMVDDDMDDEGVEDDNNKNDSSYAVRRFWEC